MDLAQPRGPATFTTAHLSVSLDGFVAGPEQSFDDPVGRGGMALHQWHFDSDQPGHEVDARWSEVRLRRRGAYVMGRNMFGPVRGEWANDPDWHGWWGDIPPYHAPVFVLTNYEREPLEMARGTTFHFVTDGLGRALELARAAGGGDVEISGGASTVRQALMAGELDELSLDIVPLLLGTGERVFDHGFRTGLEIIETEASPWATHVRYRIQR